MSKCCPSSISPGKIKASRGTRNGSVDFATVVTDLAVGTILDVEQAHLAHGLLEVEEEHGLVHGVPAHRPSGLGAGEQGLVRRQHACPVGKGEVVGVVKGVPGGVKGLLRGVPCTARLGQRPGKAGVEGRVGVAQPLLER